MYDLDVIWIPVIRNDFCTNTHTQRSQCSQRAAFRHNGHANLNEKLCNWNVNKYAHNLSPLLLKIVAGECEKFKNQNSIYDLPIYAYIKHIYLNDTIASRVDGSFFSLFYFILKHFCFLCSVCVVFSNSCSDSSSRIDFDSTACGMPVTVSSYRELYYITRNDNDDNNVFWRSFGCCVLCRHFDVDQSPLLWYGAESIRLMGISSVFGLMGMSACQNQHCTHLPQNTHNNICWDIIRAKASCTHQDSKDRHQE